MATLHLICGLPGSGKSTLAAKLEHSEAALRLTPDVWMARLVGDGFDAGKRAEVERLQQDIALRALSLGVNVVLENGFWTRAERDEVRRAAAAVGADVKLHYLDVPRDELVRRLTARNADLPPDTFVVPPESLEAWAPLFEAPTADELV